MAFNKWITLNGKKYTIVDEGWKPFVQRQKVYGIGLSGKSIIQDFTTSSREPKWWEFRIRAYTTTPPDSSWGTWTDLYAAYQQAYVSFTEHDDSKTHQVGLDSAFLRELRVPANIAGHCNGVEFIDVTLRKIYL